MTKRHGRKTKFLKRSRLQKLGSVVRSAKVRPRRVPRLSVEQKALWNGLNGDAFSVDAVAADFKKRYGSRGARSGT